MKPSPENIKKCLILAALFLVPIVISPAATFLYSTKTPFLQFFGIAVLSAWLSGLCRDKTSLEASMPDIAVLLFGLSVIRVRNSYLALEQLVFLTALVSVYYVVSKTEFSIKSAAVAVSAAGGIISIYGILQFLGYDFLADPHSQPVSTLGNVNFAGEFIAPAIILTAALLFWTGLGIIDGRDKSPRRNIPLTKNSVVISGGAIILLVFVILYNFTWFLSDWHLRRVREFRKSGEWTVAEEEAPKMLRYYYPNMPAHEVLTLACLRAGDMEKAYVSLKDMLRFYPNHHQANLFLNRLYLHASV